jgi:hypothetical protein
MEASRPDNADRRRLIWVNMALLTLVWLHDLDHVRQVREVESAVGGIGLLGVVATITSLALAIAGHRLAPLAAVVVGFGTAIGFVLVHVLPDWGPLSDGYPDLAVDGISWAIAILPIPFALWLGFTGLSALRRPAAAPAP